MCPRITFHFTGCRKPVLSTGPAITRKMRRCLPTKRIFSNRSTVGRTLFLIEPGRVEFASFQSPSFPHAFSRSTMLTALRGSKGGNPGDIRTGPPIETFGGDDFG